MNLSSNPFTMTPYLVSVTSVTLLLLLLFFKMAEIGLNRFKNVFCINVGVQIRFLSVNVFFFCKQRLAVKVERPHIWIKVQTLALLLVSMVHPLGAVTRR